MHIHHGHLVDDDGVGFQRIVGSFFKIGKGDARIPVAVIGRGKGVLRIIAHRAHAQKAMDGHGLIARRLGHSLGGPPCGRRQQYFQVLTPQIADDGIDRRGLARAGAARYDQDRVLCRHENGLPLQGIQFQVLLFFQFLQHFLRVAAAHADRLRLDLAQHACNLLLFPPGGVGVDLDFVAFSAYFDPSLHGQIVHLDL